MWSARVALFFEIEWLFVKLSSDITELSHLGGLKMSGETGSSKPECYRCNEIPIDDCAVCGNPACKKHGKNLPGNKWVCQKCLDQAQNEIDAEKAER